MKQVIILLSVFIRSIVCYGQETDYKEEAKTFSAEFIRAVKSKDKARLAKMIYYPLSRYYPIPDIKNEQEFIKRHDEIFDDSLINRISMSDPKGDWAPVGWRGIMLDQGTVWLNYGDGKVLAVNYHSHMEEKMRARLIKQEREALHASLKAFKEPILIIETKKYRVRVDELENGKYRYASWAVSKKMSEQPDLIINDGEVEYMGSGGNHHYLFKNGLYTYECDIISLGSEDDPPAKLNVYESGKEKPVLSQPALVLLK